MFKRLFPVLLVAIFAPIAAQATPQAVTQPVYQDYYWGSFRMNYAGKARTCVMFVYAFDQNVWGTIVMMVSPKGSIVLPLIGSRNGKGQYRATISGNIPGGRVTGTFGGGSTKKILNATGIIRFPKNKNYRFKARATSINH